MTFARRATLPNWNTSTFDVGVAGIGGDVIRPGYCPVRRTFRDGAFERGFVGELWNG